MSTAYEINDFVRYATNGVCQISDIVTMENGSARKKSEYYVLKPIKETTTTLYVPMDNDTLTSKMSHVLSKSQLDSLILESSRGDINWPEDRKERGRAFAEVLKTCDQQELLRLISCIYIKRRELLAAGKKLSTSDENVLKQAERLIQNDFSFVLSIKENEVGEYIRALLDGEPRPTGEQ